MIFKICISAIKKAFLGLLITVCTGNAIVAWPSFSLPTLSWPQLSLPTINTHTIYTYLAHNKYIAGTCTAGIAALYGLYSYVKQATDFSSIDINLTENEEILTPAWHPDNSSIKQTASIQSKNNNNVGQQIMAKKKRHNIVSATMLKKFDELSDLVQQCTKNLYIRINRFNEPILEHELGFLEEKGNDSIIRPYIKYLNKIRTEEEVFDLLENLTKNVLDNAKNSADDNQWLLCKEDDLLKLLYKATDAYNSFTTVYLLIGNDPKTIWDRVNNSYTHLGNSLEEQLAAYEVLGFKTNLRYSYDHQKIAEYCDTLNKNNPNGTPRGNLIRQIKITLGNAWGKKVYDAWVLDHQKKNAETDPALRGITTLAIPIQDAQKYGLDNPEANLKVHHCIHSLKSLIDYIDKTLGREKRIYL